MVRNYKNSLMRESGIQQKKNIRIFHTFEDAETYDLEQIAKQDPVKRIPETVELILRAYGFSREELIERTPSDKITIVHNQ